MSASTYFLIPGTATAAAAAAGVDVVVVVALLQCRPLY